MPLTRADALAQLQEWTTSPALLNHAKAVEAVMRRGAHRYGKGADDEETWAVAGLLHDADYDRWPDEHPNLIVGWLRDRGEDTLAQAVAAHATSRTGVAPESLLDKALFACDEITGFVMACSLVRPEGVATLTPSSVKKKLKDKSFAAKVDREEITAGAELLGVDLGEHIQLVIDALKPLADELGIAGSKA